jgi:signal transduction histidine kinase
MKLSTHLAAGMVALVLFLAATATLLRLHDLQVVVAAWTLLPALLVALAACIGALLLSRKLSASLVQMSTAMEALRLKDEFVSTVSHELRTPLTSIAGSLGLLVGGATGALSEPTTRLLAIAHSNSERLVRLINDILDIEKMESGKTVFDMRPVDLVILAEQAIDANRGYAENYRVRLRMVPGPVTAFVRADPDRLIQVITNLLSNAIKFSPRDQEVVIAVEDRGDNVRLTVRDHGIGIPESFKPRLFEKFAQAEATDARQKGGTGLGLSIVKQIVILLGGTIEFETPANGGTTFHVDLPRWEVGSDGLAPQPDVLAVEHYPHPQANQEVA